MILLSKYRNDGSIYDSFRQFLKESDRKYRPSPKERIENRNSRYKYVDMQNKRKEAAGSWEDIAYGKQDFIDSDRFCSTLLDTIDKSELVRITDLDPTDGLSIESRNIEVSRGEIVDKANEILNSYVNDPEISIGLDFNDNGCYIYLNISHRGIAEEITMKYSPASFSARETAIEIADYLLGILEDSYRKVKAIIKSYPKKFGKQ